MCMCITRAQKTHTYKQEIIIDPIKNKNSREEK